METSAAVQVTRGSESWQFFAFVFGAGFALAITLLDSLAWFETLPSWAKIVSKIGVFAICFYVSLVNNWTRNELVKFLGWLKVEHD